MNTLEGRLEQKNAQPAAMREIGKAIDLAREVPQGSVKRFLSIAAVYEVLSQPGFAGRAWGQVETARLRVQLVES